MIPPPRIRVIPAHGALLRYCHAFLAVLCGLLVSLMTTAYFCVTLGEAHRSPAARPFADLVLTGNVVVNALVWWALLRSIAVYGRRLVLDPGRRRMTREDLVFLGIPFSVRHYVVTPEHRVSLNLRRLPTRLSETIRDSETPEWEYDVRLHLPEPDRAPEILATRRSREAAEDVLGQILLFMHLAHQPLTEPPPPAVVGIQLGEMRLLPPTPAGICQVCGDALGHHVHACPACETPHHEECWKYVGGCSTYGCRGHAA